MMSGDSRAALKTKFESINARLNRTYATAYRWVTADLGH